MKGFPRTVIILLGLLTMAACETFGTFSSRGDRFDRVFIVYSLGFNNLSHDLNVNIDSLCAGDIPGKWSKDAIVVFSHSLNKGGSYGTPSKPAVFRIYSENGIVVRDTSGYFHAGVESATTEVLSTSLQYIKDNYPSKSYSMLLSSHATGWIYPGYTFSTPGIITLSHGKTEYPEWPETKSIGASYSLKNSYIVSTEMDLKEFASAIPMHLDCLIFDACLMGGVEVAYELKDVCNRLLFSPTEVLTKGFCYTPMAAHMFSGSSADLKAIGEDYFNYYMTQTTGSVRSATITEVDTKGLDGLAKTYASIRRNHSQAFASMSRKNVQRYFYASPGDSRYKPFYYDLRDAAREYGATADELAELDEALSKCVTYHAETPKFFDVTLDRCCGLSMYLPIESCPDLNAYYKTLNWNSAIGLVE